MSSFSCVSSKRSSKQVEMAPGVTGVRTGALVRVLLAMVEKDWVTGRRQSRGVRTGNGTGFPC